MFLYLQVLINKKDEVQRQKIQVATLTQAYKKWG
jgi:hypothetical protein